MKQLGHQRLVATCNVMPHEIPFFLAPIFVLHQSAQAWAMRMVESTELRPYLK